MELAGVDITAEAMEVGPTCHYIMGGVRVDADTAATAVPGLFAAGEVAGGMHGSNRLGRQLALRPLVFGRRAGHGRLGLRGEPAAARRPSTTARSAPRRSRRPWRRSRAPRARTPTRSSTTSRRLMQDLVGIIRTGSELETGPREARRARASGPRNIAVDGGRAYNPGWNLATDLPGHAHRLQVRDPRGPRPQGEPRRAHPGGLPDRRPRVRQDQPRAVASRRAAAWTSEIKIAPEPIPQMPAELQAALRGGQLMTDDVTMRVWRGDAEGGEFARLHAARPGGRGGPRRHPPHPGHPGRRPRLPLELQGRQVRLAARPRSTAGRGSCA